MDGCQFGLLVDDIAAFLGILNEGHVTYFENMTSDVLFQIYIPIAKLNESVLKFRVRYKNPMNVRDLTLIVFTFGQIMMTNVFPQGRHLNDVSNFKVYVLWKFASRKQINLRILILNHMFRYRNQGRSKLPYIQTLAPMFLKNWSGFHHYCGDVIVWMVNIAPIKPLSTSRNN